MEIRILSPKFPVLRNRGLKLGRKIIKVLNGYCVYSPADFEKVKKTILKIWDHLYCSKEFTGIVRFDLIPFFQGEGSEERNVVNLGPLSIKGVYEVNAHSPECAAAISALHRAAPELVEVQPSAVGRLAEAIRQTFGDRELIFVPGNGLVKRSWGKIFFENLYQAGLNIRWSDPKKVLMSPPSLEQIIWRWGDLRMGGGTTEYDLRFCNFLLGWKGTIFNTVPSIPEEDPGNKGLLFPGENSEWGSLVGKNFVLSPERFELAKENKDDLVLKPLRGSSGLGITFGRLTTPEEWETKLTEILGGQPFFGLFEARWLPKIVLFGKPHAMDLNVTCWADRGHLQYLYSFIRIDEWGRYWRRGTINVARGAAFAGPIDDLSLVYNDPEHLR